MTEHVGRVIIIIKYCLHRKGIYTKYILQCCTRLSGSVRPSRVPTTTAQRPLVLGCTTTAAVVSEESTKFATTFRIFTLFYFLQHASISADF